MSPSQCSAVGFLMSKSGVIFVSSRSFEMSPPGCRDRISRDAKTPFDQPTKKSVSPPREEVLVIQPEVELELVMPQSDESATETPMMPLVGDLEGPIESVGVDLLQAVQDGRKGHGFGETDELDGHGTPGCSRTRSVV